MSHTTLYRKFRPQIFDDVFGQDTIVAALRNQISNGRIGHAYLFTGTRGTGKTTIAKIFARAVNCENPSDGNPCGECASCKSILNGSSLSVFEIDGASNNGIDNIRDIIEEISYPPIDGKYKVYIIDEVHAISANAFQALLKTLEEPPEYVIFILATTEVAALPTTILSRCQRYDFRRISIPTIEERLREVVNAENIDIEDKAIRYIARMADGSMRDALSLLDQGVAFSTGETLKYDYMLEVLGAVDTRLFSKLIVAVHNMDAPAAIRVVDEIIMEGKEPSTFASDMVWYLRNLLLVKSGEDLENILDISTDNLHLLAQEAELLSEAELMRDIRLLSEAVAALRLSSFKRVTLEIAIMRMCRPQMEAVKVVGVPKIKDPIEKPPTREPIKKEPILTEETFEESIEKKIEPETAAITEDGDMPSFWRAILGAADGMTRVYLEASSPSYSEDKGLELTYNVDDTKAFAAASSFSIGQNKDKLKQLIKEKTGLDMIITIKEIHGGQNNKKEYSSSEEETKAVTETDLEKVFGMPIETEDF